MTGQPFDHYDRLREQAPVAWIEFDEKYPDFKGYWALTKYADIKQAEVLPEIFSSQAGSIFLTTGFKRAGNQTFTGGREQSDLSGPTGTHPVAGCSTGTFSPRNSPNA